MALCSHENFIRCYCVRMSVACLLELSRPSTGTTKVSDSPVCTSCYFPVVDFFDSVPSFIFSITGLRFSPLSSDHQPCLSHCCTVLPRHCQPRMPTPILNCPRFLHSDVGPCSSVPIVRFFNPILPSPVSSSMDPSLLAASLRSYSLFPVINFFHPIVTSRTQRLL